MDTDALTFGFELQQRIGTDMDVGQVLDECHVGGRLVELDMKTSISLQTNQHVPV